MNKLKLLRLLMLLLWVASCSVSSTTQCGKNEFKHENLCCQLCSAGTSLTKPCQRNHGESECAPCQPQSYTDHNNSEYDCSPCSLCRDDQEEVSQCSSTADRKCWCKQGTYCNSENCVEMCLECSSCPEGRVIQECNATMDTVCRTLDSKPGLEPWAISVIVAATVRVSVLVIAIICYCCKKDRRTLKDVNGNVSNSTMLESFGREADDLPEAH